MANSGVEEILQKRFAGVQKLLVGKNYPSNVRALRLLEGILKLYISKYKSYEELMTSQLSGQMDMASNSLSEGCGFDPHPGDIEWLPGKQL